MGKKRSARVVEEKAEIICFYCDRVFDDEKVQALHAVSLCSSSSFMLSGSSDNVTKEQKGKYVC